MRSTIIVILISIGALPVLAAPIHDAAAEGDLTALAAMTAATPSALDDRDARGRTPLHLAVARNRSRAAAWLLEAGAEPDVKDGSGQTPLFIALDRGRTRVAVMLLENGADHRALGRRALGMAVRAGSERAAAIMIERGAPVEVAGGDGFTPLAQAVERGHVDLAGLFLRHGADPDTRLAGGIPVLCWAAATGRSAVVELLIRQGAAPDAVSPDGRSALTLARSHGHAASAEVLLAAGAADKSMVQATGALLERDLAPGEAVMWHLGHCGWAIRTAGNLLIFDYFPPRWQAARPGLANGLLIPEELAGQKITVFVTHGHRDHLDPAIHGLAALDATFVYGFRPDTAGPSYMHAPPRTRHDLDGMVVETIESNDEGVGFLVTVDGVSVYHAGDHAGWREGERAAYAAEIDHLAGLGGRIDVAFLNVTGCHTHGQCALDDGTRYTLDRLAPAAWFPTHAGDREHVYAEFADRARAGGFASTLQIPTFRGDVFVYRNGNISRP